MTDLILRNGKFVINDRDIGKGPTSEPAGAKTLATVVAGKVLLATCPG